ncbi:MAG: hypothetical protein ACI97X_000783, partial [Oceanospirillaceae bacterium]
LVGTGLGDNLGNHSATTTLQMGNREVNQVTYLDITAGSDYGVRFWDGSDSYKIQMGNDQQDYGWVTDYSIHSNMNDQPNRGWTWGYSDANVQTSLSTEGHFRTRGVVYAENYVRSNNAYYSDGNVVIDDNGGWHRTYGNTGWYNQTHGGGIYMTDNTWVRTYGSKNFYCDQQIQAGSLVRSPTFIDLNDSYYFLDPNSWSRTTGDFWISHNGGQVKVGHNYSPNYCVGGNYSYSCGWNGWSTCWAYNPCLTTNWHDKLTVYGQARAYSWAGWSDGRYKKNVSTIEGAVSLIKQMRGVTYDWKELTTANEDAQKYGKGEYVDQSTPYQGMRSDMGVIAQELQKVLPNSVKESDVTDDEGTLQGTQFAVDYDNIIPVLIEAIKEQQAMIEELQMMAGLNAGSGMSEVGGLSQDALVNGMLEKAATMDADVQENVKGLVQAIRDGKVQMNAELRREMNDFIINGTIPQK